MNTPIQTAFKGIRVSLQFITRIRYVEYLLLIILIFYKLVLFDKALGVPLIQMEREDVVIAIGSIFLCSFWILLLPLRGRIISVLLIDLLLTALIYSDLVYFRYFQDFISIPVLLQAGQVSSLGDSIKSLLYWGDLQYFIDQIILIPLGIFAFIKIGKMKKLSAKRPSTSHVKTCLFKLGLSAIIFALGVACTMLPIQNATKTWAKGIFVGNWWNVSLYNVTGLLGFHGYDVYRYAQEHWLSKTVLSEAEKKEVEDWFAEKKKEQAAAPKNNLFGAYKNSNIIVIQAEAFQNFVIGQKINGVEVTPNINKIMKESMYFSNFYHQTGQGRTSDADFSAHSSLHPLPTGSVFIRYPNHSYDMLPQILKDQGYSTGAYHAYDASFWNRYNMYNQMGYDRFYSKKDYTIDEPLGWSLGDASFFRQSVDYMKQNKAPFYSFLISLSSHHPYTLPEDHQVLDMGDLKGTIFGDYIQSLHYVDDAFGKMVEQMKSEGLWDKTILLFYGDHDNSIKEKGPMEQFLGRSLTDIEFEQIHNQVPMLVHLPDGAHAGVYDAVGGQLDMAPSLLYLLGIKPEDYYMMGNNLFTDDKKLVVFRTGAYTDGQYFFIPAADGNLDNGSCYDLKTGKTTSAAACRTNAERAKKQLEMSDKIILNDLLAEFRKKQ